jgi:pSer/pThr/pTyr-binding forkhead associated (FHA) protein
MNTPRNGTGSMDNNGKATGRTKTVLRGLEGGVEGKNFLLDMPEIVVGRSTRATLRLLHSGVSRRHARLIALGGVYWVEDLGSSRGTFLNESRIAQRAVLSHRDTLRVGRVAFSVALVSDVNDVPGLVERVSRIGMPALSGDPELEDFAEFMLANTSVTSTIPDAGPADDADADDEDDEDDEEK